MYLEKGQSTLESNRLFHGYFSLKKLTLAFCFDFSAALKHPCRDLILDTLK